MIKNFYNFSKMKINNHIFSIIMNYNVWKETRSFSSTKKQDMEALMDEFHVEVVKTHRNMRSWVVKGQCQTDGCVGMYEKTLETIAKCGPFCQQCIYNGHFLEKPVNPNRMLLSDQYPEIYKTIVSCDYPKERLTIGSERKARFRCEEQCSRCETHHEWEAMIYNRVGRDSGCPVCSGHETCPCQTEDEFKCSICKKIKKKEDANYGHVCKICHNSNQDNTLEKCIKRLWTTIQQRMKRDPRKRGDLTEKHIHLLYRLQCGRCYITGVKMSVRGHSNWKMSIERIDESIGYDKKNVVLIVSECQSGHRQWTREIFDKVCSLVLGNQLEQDVREIITTELSSHPIQIIRERQDDETQQHHTKMRRRMEEATPQGRLKKLLYSSKSNAKTRGLEHTISLQDIHQQLLFQNGRCFYSNIPLTFDGLFQMSLERIDPKKGYLPNNIGLIILGLNVGDRTRLKLTGDEREGSSGWSREKVLWVVENRPREVIPTDTSIADIWMPFQTMIRKQI